MKSPYYFLLLLLQIPLFAELETPDEQIVIQVSKKHQFYEAGLPHLRELLNEQFPGFDGVIFNSLGSQEDGYKFERTGSIETRPFLTRYSIDLLFTGHPLDSGRVRLINTHSEESISLRFRSGPSNEKWAHYKWKIPKEWQEKECIIRIDDVLEEEGFGWLAVCFPLNEVQSPTLYIQLLEGSGFILTILYQFVIFLLPGLAAMITISRYYRIHECFKLPIIFTSIGILGHLAVYLYLFANEWGKLFSLLTNIGSISILIFSRRKLLHEFSKQLNSTPIILIIITALFIWSTAMITYSRESSIEVSKFRFCAASTTDSIIPYLFAERLYFEEPLQPFAGEWLTSDRPPLQTGLFLLQRPFLLKSLPQYHVLGAILQCTLFASVFHFVFSIFRDRKLALISVLLSLLCGLTLQNAFYVWPKLLSASFVFYAYALLFVTEQELIRGKKLRWILMGLSASLALLSHGGSIFGLFALPFCILLRPSFRKIQYPIIAALSFFACYSPWVTYQKLVDPPGDRLLKWHLAGSPEVDDRGSLEALFDAYSNLSFHDWWRARNKNFEAVTRKWEQYFPLLHPKYAAQGFFKFKKYNFIHFVFSLGVLNAAWIGLLVLFLKRTNEASRIRELFCILISGLFFWCVAIYTPGRTTLWQGSYFLSYLAIILATTAFYRISKYLAYGVLSIQALIFIFVWNIPFLRTHSQTAIYSETLYSIPMILLNIFMWMVLFYFFSSLKPRLRNIIQNEYSHTR